MFSMQRTLGGIGALVASPMVAYFAKPYVEVAAGVTAKVGLAAAILGGATL